MHTFYLFYIDRTLDLLVKYDFARKMVLDDGVAKYENKISEVGYVLNKKIINYKFSKDDKNNDNFSILVLGGSQGAEIFGNIIPKVVNMIKNKGYAISISQQCIDKQKNILSDFYDKNGIIN